MMVGMMGAEQNQTKKNKGVGRVELKRGAHLTKKRKGQVHMKKIWAWLFLAQKKKFFFFRIKYLIAFSAKKNYKPI